MVDMVVHRHELRATLANLCRLLTKAPAPSRRASAAERWPSVRHAPTRGSASAPAPDADEPSHAMTPDRLPSSRGSRRCIPSGSTCRSTACGGCSAALGHPERKLPPVIHVAGTNGKGSTIAFMRAMLEAAGHARARLHLAASRALQRALPPRRAGRRQAGRDDASWPRRWPSASASMRGAPITVFEITTAAGFLLFARHPADVLLLEVGLGGRLDATNVIERRWRRVITPVSIDHAEHSSATRSARSPPRRPASSSAACRRSWRRSRARRSR